jgi:hypothetical protein
MAKTIETGLSNRGLIPNASQLDGEQLVNQFLADFRQY